MKTPVIVVGYNRSDTIRLVLNNLSNCYGVKDREIFVFIDGARSDDDVLAVEEVCCTVRKFKGEKLPNIVLKERDRNIGCRENIVQAVNEILDGFGRMCLLEDDVLPSRTFLEYMDGALDFYEDDQRIFNVNAYVERYLRIPSKYPYDVYLDLRNHSPGWGIWKSRWDLVDFDLKDWNDFKVMDGNRVKVDNAGIDLFWMIDKQANSPNSLNTWDVQCSYHMIKHGLYSLAPRYTLTKNIGFGMKSAHCWGYNPVMPTQRYYDFIPRFVKNLQPCKEIERQLKYVVCDTRWFSRVIRKIHRGLLYFSPKYMAPGIPPKS